MPKVTDFEIYDFAVLSDDTAIYTTLHGIKQISLSHKKHLVIKSFPHKFAYDLCVSPSEEFLATVGDEIKLWDIHTGELLRTFPNIYGKLAFISDTQLMVGQGDIKCLNLVTGEIDYVLMGRFLNTSCVSYEHGEFCSGGDKSLFIWDLTTRDLKRTVKWNSGGVSQVKITPHTIYVSSGLGFIHEIDR